MNKTTVIMVAAATLACAAVGGLSLALLNRNQQPAVAPPPAAARDGDVAAAGDVAVPVEVAVDGNGPKLRTLPVLMAVPEFSLTDQTGQPFGSDQLAGRAWIANFIFTRCTATCPIQTSHLAQLQEDLRQTNLWEDIRLVSISVDPTYDTPQVLAQYAQRTGADEQHWRFLTGSRQDIWQLSKQGFKLPVQEDAANTKMPIAHSSKFVLVDPQGYIRGFFDSQSPEEREQLKRQVELVVEERVLAPPEILDPPWLQQRRQAQLESVGKFDVFHDFSFADRVRESGIGFRHRIVDDAGRSWKPAHYDHGNGVAVGDVDGDGRYDIYFTTQVGPNELWRNVGDGKFENMTNAAGVAVADRISVAASLADIDNDGDLDLYVTTVRGGNVLFENQGGGKFKDISRQAGVDYLGHSSAAVFFDYNRDGLLDLFLVNVGKYTLDETAIATNDSFTGPDTNQYSFYPAYADAFAGHIKPERAERSILFENQGNNRFRDVSEQVDLLDLSWSGDASPLDLNQDGWTDLYVINMQGHDQYYENVEGKRFVKKSRDVFPQTPWGTMGIKVCDFDNDGHMDIYLTDMHTDMAMDLSPEDEKQKILKEAFESSLMQTDGNHVWGNAFFRNQGNGSFEEISDAIGAENYWPWGLSVGDLNADGFADVFIASSMNYLFRYAINSVLLNNHGQQFLDSEFILGVEPRRGGRTAVPWFELDAAGKDRDHPLCVSLRSRGNRAARIVVWGALGSRSSVIFDLDNDGDLDIVTNDFNSQPMVLVSDLTEKKEAVHFLKVKLKGSKSNRDGLGATVRVRAGAQTYTQVHDGKSGYLSQSQFPLYFGLGDADAVEQVEIRWPSGQTQIIAPPIKVNSLMEVEEP